MTIYSSMKREIQYARWKLFLRNALYCYSHVMYFYRQIKNFIKNIQNYLFKNKRKILSQWKIQHSNPFSTSSIDTIFQSMLRHTWFASGFINKHTIFLNVNQICFFVELSKYEWYAINCLLYDIQFAKNVFTFFIFMIIFILQWVIKWNVILCKNQ